MGLFIVIRHADLLRENLTQFPAANGFVTLRNTFYRVGSEGVALVWYRCVVSWFALSVVMCSVIGGFSVQNIQVFGLRSPAVEVILVVGLIVVPPDGLGRGRDSFRDLHVAQTAVQLPGDRAGPDRVGSSARKALRGMRSLGPFAGSALPVVRTGRVESRLGRLVRPTAERRLGGAAVGGRKERVGAALIAFFGAIAVDPELERVRDVLGEGTFRSWPPPSLSGVADRSRNCRVPSSGYQSPRSSAHK